VDYLLKPFTKKRFEDALRKVKQQIELRKKAEPLQQAIAILDQVQGKKEYLQRLGIKRNQGIAFLACSEIDWIESEDNYVLVHAGRGEHLIRESLNAMEQSLDPSQFLRIHRRILVNTNRISEMRQLPATRVILHNGVALPVSRRMKERVKRFLLNKKS
jgi:two-component system LytT family response regulator